MNIEVRAYTDNDIEAMVTIWNQVVEDGVAFPQEECLTPESGTAFFAEQTYCGVAEDTDTGRIYGHVHPASEQCWTMWAHLQCQLCGRPGIKRIAYRREAGV